MARNTGVWEPPKLDLSIDRFVAFQAWYDKWTDWAVVTKLDQEDAAYKVSMLRYAFTEETRRIYNTLALSVAEAADHNAIIAKLKAFAKGTVNETVIPSTPGIKRKERHSMITLLNSRSYEKIVTSVQTAVMVYYATVL